MTQQHPITPLPKLFQRWSEQFEAGRPLYAMFEDIYRAGADAELEACCEWLKLEGHEHEHEALLTARRPKPPSLKEQALEALASAPGPDYPIVMTMLNADQHALIRRALEQLPDNN